MLVSAAMADRPRATASGRSRPAPAPGPAAPARHSTARVATTAGVRRSDLPGWFWGALGCMTVLVIGLTVVFFMSQPGGFLAAPASGPAAAAVAPGAPVATAPLAAPGAR